MNELTSVSLPLFRWVLRSSFPWFLWQFVSSLFSKQTLSLRVNSSLLRFFSCLLFCQFDPLLECVNKNQWSDVSASVNHKLRAFEFSNVPISAESKSKLNVGEWKIRSFRCYWQWSNPFFRSRTCSINASLFRWMTKGRNNLERIARAGKVKVSRKSSKSVPKDTHPATCRWRAPRIIELSPAAVCSPLVGDNSAQVEPHSQVSSPSHLKKTVNHCTVDTAIGVKAYPCHC